MPNLMPNGLERYYADRVRNLGNWRISQDYEIIDRLRGHQHPIKCVSSASEMERELARLNA